ncbi:MAG: amidohydrolase family protein [Deltaproteobacteria bacterium]|nr:amidohydrolase family protein [Deltaproteobacteria bacterium]
MPTRAVVDFHVHLARYEPPSPSLNELMGSILGSTEHFTRFARMYDDPANFLQLMRDEGVDYAVILAEYTPLTTGVASHERVREFCAGHKELIAFCTINPHDNPDPVRNLHRLHDEGFRGIKLYPTYNHFHVNEARLYPVYAAAQELRMPVLIHTGTSVFKNARLKYGNPIFVDDVAVDFPDLTLVMAHGGRGAWYDEAMTVARLHANVSIDLSGLPVRKLSAYFPELERFSHKFVFGTDWPQISPKKNLATFQEIGLSDKALDAILGGNALRILGMR